MRWLRRESRAAGGGVSGWFIFLRGLVQKSWGSGGGGLALVGSQDSFPSFAWRLTSLEGGGGLQDLPVFSVYTTVNKSRIITGLVLL